MRVCNTCAVDVDLLKGQGHAITTMHPNNEVLRILPQNEEKIANYWPDDLIRTISGIIDKPCEQPVKTEFKFTLDKESVAKNFCVMRKYGNYWGKAIKAQSKSPLGYGSEFRPTNILEKVFKKHPDLIRIKDILENGSNWPLEKLSEENRRTDMEKAIALRNHKGAEKNPALLRSLVEKNITHGYNLVLPLKKVNKILGLLLAPMNIITKTPSTSTA